MRATITALVLVFALAVPAFAITAVTDATVGTEQSANAHTSNSHCSGTKWNVPYSNGVAFKLTKHVGSGHQSYCVLVGTVYCYNEYSYYTRITSIVRSGKGSSTAVKSCYSGDTRYNSSFYTYAS